MAGTTQVAFQLDNDSLAELDTLVSSEFPSRAQLIRTAVHEWLDRRREAQVDAALAAGYGVEPEGGEAERWAELSVEGLETSNLDW